MLRSSYDLKPRDHLRCCNPFLGGRGALAGEFVSAAYGTTSGAWDSGVRAAECVVGLGGCAESDSAAGVPPTDRLLVVLALAVAMLA